MLRKAAQKHADVSNAVAAWLAVVSSARWRSLVDLKPEMASADYVPPFTVFNIKGNRYRLIALVDYAEEVVVVRALLTHSAYDKGAWK